MLGVRYKDGLDIQIVLLPHLISFVEGCTMIGEEVKGLVSKGWYSLHHLLPYVPFRKIPRGAVSKDDGTWRPTAEGGAPRKPIADSAGNPVVSQNTAIKMAD